MADKIVKQITDKLYGDDEPTPTKFRAWHIPQIPGKAFKVEASDFATAKLVEGLLAAYDEFQYEHNIKPDYANMSGIEYWDETDGEWYSIDESEYDEWEGK